MLGMCRFCIIHPIAILACFQIFFKIRNMLIGNYSALLLHIFWILSPELFFIIRTERVYIYMCVCVCVCVCVYYIGIM